MNELIIIGLAVFVWYFLKKDEIPQYYYEPTGDYYFLPVAALYFENDVMRYKEKIMKSGDENNIEGAIIAAMIAHESKGNPNAINGRFTGLMQIGFSEAKFVGFKGDPEALLNPDVNIYWATKYLKYCIEQKSGDLFRGISGYNSGNVERPNTPYMTEYVNSIVAYVPRFRYLLAQSFPGYARVFPPESWLETDTVYA